MKINQRGIGLNPNQIMALQNLEKRAGTQKGQSNFKGLSLANTYDVDNYTKTGQLNTISRGTLPSVSSIDKGTAAETTVYVNRSAFDTIVSATTYGKPQWEELGVDDEKRWVVIDGQRFEVPHSAEEKAQRQRAKRMTLVDIIDEQRKKKDEKTEKKQGNTQTLLNNKPVMAVLKDIFNVKTDDQVLKAIL